MSKYEFQKGAIKIPSAAWAGFKKDLQETYNKIQAGDYVIAKALCLHLRHITKAKRKAKIDFAGLIREALDKGFYLPHEIQKCDGNLAAHFGKFGPVQDEDRLNKISGAVFDAKANKIKAPKKQEFALATKKTCSYNAGRLGATIKISDDKLRTVVWDVPENNHSARDANGSDMGVAFFRALDRISSNNGWTRGSGGEIVGNDEYNRESEFVGGGANYAVATFGPENNARNMKRVNCRF